MGLHGKADYFAHDGYLTDLIAPTSIYTGHYCSSSLYHVYQLSHLCQQILINKCASGVHNCHVSASWTNTLGSFGCSRNLPHEFEGNGRSSNLPSGRKTIQVFSMQVLHLNPAAVSIATLSY